MAMTKPSAVAMLERKPADHGGETLTKVVALRLGPWRYRLRCRRRQLSRRPRRPLSAGNHRGWCLATRERWDDGGRKQYSSHRGQLFLTQEALRRRLSAAIGGLEKASSGRCRSRRSGFETAPPCLRYRRARLTLPVLRARRHRCRPRRSPLPLPRPC
ncbi:unnamed protein product [Pylaiella littoralis]